MDKYDAILLALLLVASNAVIWIIAKAVMKKPRA